MLRFKPFLIKPNNHELGEIFGVELKTREEVIPYAAKLQAMGAQNVLVSMAGEGAVLLDDSGSIHMAAAPDGKLVNAVGAGDSMVAGFLAGWLGAHDYSHAFKMGVAAGSASAFSEFLATEDEVKSVYRQLKNKYAIKRENGMRIIDLLDERSISLDAAPTSKNEALDMVIELMIKSGKIRDKEAYKKQVYLREEESTTGIGGGIAIPHGRCSAVKKPGLAVMVVRDGVDFASLDGEPVNLIFLIAAPDTKDNVHLDILSKLSVLLMDEDFTARLKTAKTVEEFLKVIDAADNEKPALDAGR